MQSSTQRPDPPYLAITAQIRERILSGDLKPGERAPSIRQIVQRWGVAVATATRVTATLRAEGLVETRVGSGTVVSARPGTARQGVARPAGPGAPGGSTAPSTARSGGLSDAQVVHAAIAIADTEGLDAVSMRRLAAHLGVGPMSLYRHVANKDELLAQMADAAFGEIDLPEQDRDERQGGDSWRAKLELVSRRQWELCARHLWLPRTVSFTRPLLVPSMMQQTEWTLRALDGLGLSIATRMREALTLHALVLTAASSLANEVEVEQATGVTLDGWRLVQHERAQELLGSGRFPLLAAVPEDTAPDLGTLFEYSLARHLDGLAALVAERSTAAEGEQSRG